MFVEGRDVVSLFRNIGCFAKLLGFFAITDGKHFDFDSKVIFIIVLR